MTQGNIKRWVPASLSVVAASQKILLGHFQTKNVTLDVTDIFFPVSVLIHSSLRSTTDGQIDFFQISLKAFYPNNMVVQLNVTGY